MFRVLSSLLVILLAVGAAGFGCAAPTPVPEPLVPCEVSLSSVGKVFYGKESTTVEVTFTVRNPNEVMVTLNELTYDLNNDDDLLGTGGVNDDVYIPGGKEVKVSTAFPIGFATIIGAFMMQGGLAQDKAVESAGALFQRIGEDQGTWYVKGQARISTSLGAMEPVFFQEQYSVE